MISSMSSKISAKADVFLLKWILHDWNDVRCREILRNVRRAMGESSKLLIIEQAVPEDDDLSEALSTLKASNPLVRGW